MTARFGIDPYQECILKDRRAPRIWARSSPAFLLSSYVGPWLRRREKNGLKSKMFYNTTVDLPMILKNNLDNAAETNHVQYG